MMMKKKKNIMMMTNDDGDDYTENKNEIYIQYQLPYVDLQIEGDTCRPMSLPYVEIQLDPSEGNVRPRSTLQYASINCVGKESFTKVAPGY